MRYTGKNNEYFEINSIGIENKHLIEQSQASELIILWFDSDTNVLKIDGVAYTFNTNDIVFLTEFHKVEVQQLTSTRIIKWNKFFYCIINHDSAVGCKGILFYGAIELPVIRPSEEEHTSIASVWEMLCDEIKSSNDVMQQEMLEMTLKRLLVLCTRMYKNKTELQKVDAEQIDIIRQYHYLVEQHFKLKHTVADYAVLLHKSPKTLSNTFKKLGSKSPLQFIKERRMLEAKRLLSYSDLSVSEVGYELGFSDIQSFSRFFKREEGISPNIFRA